MVSDAASSELAKGLLEFQSALRFAVVSDKEFLELSLLRKGEVSIRFEVRGGFRPWPLTQRTKSSLGFNPL